MYLAIVGLCLAAVITVYFRNNPLHHSRAFIWRRFLNWFPLGMTYSFLYMGRYNLVVSKNALGSLMSNHQFGTIFGVGTLVYALSFIVNGPVVDRIGGRKGILIAGFGSAAANIALGILTHFVTATGAHINLVVPYSILYAFNMYFQSYGAVSIIKVKSYWFHVRERGVFGAIFGTLISFGVYFAIDWCGEIVKHFPGQLDAVFYIPAAIITVWTVSDLWAVRNSPDEVGFVAFDTADASSGHMEEEYTFLQLLGKVFGSPLMLLIATVELTSGVFRNGITQWYQSFAKQVPSGGSAWFSEHWGFLICVFGVIGGFAAGIVSDKVFQSRRGPPCAILCSIVLVLSIAMSSGLRTAPLLVGWSSIGIAMCAVGITSLMSGTAATDFGGRKATATCAGIVDGFAYLGSSIQSYELGRLTERDWKWWPIFLMPFAVLGLLIALRIWSALPPATRRYLKDVEHVGLKDPIDPARQTA